jgi:hypothetical protein
LLLLLLLLPPHKIIRLALAGIRLIIPRLLSARRHTHGQGDQRSVSSRSLLVCPSVIFARSLAPPPIDLHCGRPIGVLADSHTAARFVACSIALGARTCPPTVGKLKWWVSLCLSALVIGLGEKLLVHSRPSENSLKFQACLRPLPFASPKL